MGGGGCFFHCTFVALGQTSVCWSTPPVCKQWGPGKPGFKIRDEIKHNWQDSLCSSWPPLWTHVPGIPWHNIKVHILTNRIDCNTDAYSIMFHKEIRKVWAWTTCAQHFLMEHYTQVLGYVSWFVYYVFNFGLHERDTHHYGTLCMYVDLFVLLSYTGPNCHRTLQDT